MRLKLGSPILFRQQRPGLHGRPVTLYKFRTMTGARDAAGRRMALERFDERLVFEKVQAEYARLLREKGLPVPRPRVDLAVSAQG